MATSKIKISILTFSKGDNYGAVLQSYALGQFLREHGYKIEYIHLTWTTLRYQITSTLTPLKRNFENFRKHYLKDFSKECHSKDDLREAVKHSQICIVGSDQVWNVDITKWRALFYFLDFVPDSIGRIAYAASFGKKEWDWPNLFEKIKTLLSRFDSVSVREIEGKEICNKFGIKASVVLDPTFLLSSYHSLLQSPKYPNSIIGFMFHPSNSYYKLLDKLYAYYNTNVVVMDLPSRKTTWKAFKYKLSPFCKVNTWLTNIANAKFVVTDSFHCLAFSLIFNKQFVFIASNPSLLSRITTILNEVDLSDRIFLNPHEAIEKICHLTPIDYIKVNHKLSKYREESSEFLLTAIDKILNR